MIGDALCKFHFKKMIQQRKTGIGFGDFSVYAQIPNLFIFSFPSTPTRKWLLLLLNACQKNYKLQCCHFVMVGKWHRLPSALVHHSFEHAPRIAYDILTTRTSITRTCTLCTALHHTAGSLHALCFVNKNWRELALDDKVQTTHAPYTPHITRYSTRIHEHDIGPLLHIRYQHTNTRRAHIRTHTHILASNSYGKLL